MRRDTGWAPLPRAAVAALLGDANGLAVFMVLTGWATVEDSPEVRKGQAILSLRELAAATGLSLKAIRCAIVRLAARKLLTARGTALGTGEGTPGTVVTINHLVEFYAETEVEGHKEGHSEGHSKNKNNNISPERDVEVPAKDAPLFAAPDAEKATATAAPHLAIWRAWKDHHGALAGLRDDRPSPKRVTKLRARWREIPDAAYWEAAVKRMAASTFMREWKGATFDWLVANGGGEDANHAKVTAGNYDDRAKVVPFPRAEPARPRIGARNAPIFTADDEVG